MHPRSRVLLFSKREDLSLRRCYSDINGHPRVLGIPIPKTLMIWASPLTLTLTQNAKVILEGDAHITRVLGMGMPKTDARMPISL